MGAVGVFGLTQKIGVLVRGSCEWNDTSVGVCVCVHLARTSMQGTRSRSHEQASKRRRDLRLRAPIRSVLQQQIELLIHLVQDAHPVRGAQRDVHAQDIGARTHASQAKPVPKSMPDIQHKNEDKARMSWGQWHLFTKHRHITTGRRQSHVCVYTHTHTHTHKHTHM